MTPTPSIRPKTVQVLQRIRRARRRGATLVEVLIVIAIMALITGGVGFLILPKYAKAQIDTARTDARNIRRVVTMYVAMHSSEECPTVEVLVAAKEIDAAGNVKDPWGNAYAVRCDGDDIMVSSAGPDKQDGTDDDIVVGGVAAAEE